ncbi:MAG TPA: alpha-glucan family phosphorylase [Prolixibacteraceae bacterium]|nr:alpha-glucan family phosphorylase [Prolixibacteraceae bacterium]
MEQPVWKKLFVESNIPEMLAPLKELSRNLWWVWNTEARELFQMIDAEIFDECEHNPILLLERVSYQRFLDLENDDAFILKMNNVWKSLQTYLNERKTLHGPSIAYFSMEYGLHDSLKIFSGGLGILAGDYLKEASDSKVNLVGVGLLYRYGYFRQNISIAGEQLSYYDAQQFSKIPVQPAFDQNGEWVSIEVEYPGRTVSARVWQVSIGSVRLFLLDTDFDSNIDEDRFVTHHLYGGDNENRLKQEMLLGLGGIRVLKKLGIEADIYHCNEGHAAMIGLERIKDLVESTELKYAEAKEVVRASTLFTTHTPVPAGHDSFHQDLFQRYMDKYPEKVNITWEEFLSLGKANVYEDHFNMSYLACNLSVGINGVSRLHGDVSKEILRPLYEGYLAEEIEIGYVTNGVHYSTWVAKEWKEIHQKYFGEKFPQEQLDIDVWEHIYKIPDEEIWKIKQSLRLKTIGYIKQRFTDTWIQRHENPKQITEVLGKLNPNALTVGFARRFATYKRAHLLFRNLDRLSKLVNDPERPVQFIFAGKAHPADKAGQDLIRYIVEISKRPEFIGKILFVQNYDMNLAKMMLQGVDIWMNTPTRPLEASGTSGEKGVMNGTIHFSVLDGWWVEGYKKDAGWALPQENSYDLNELQDELDAETIYNIFDDEILPAFYSRNAKGIPEKWVSYIKNTFAQVAPHFTTARMIRDYQVRFYNPQAERAARLKASNFKLSKELASWKAHVSSIWNDIEVMDIQITDGITNVLKIGEKYPARVVIDLKGLKPEEVGVEMVVTENGEDNAPVTLVDCLQFEVEKTEGTVLTYKLNLQLMNSGAFGYAIRVYPKHPELPHRQDFHYLKWL